MNSSTTDLTGHRRSSYFSSCMSPSCVPVHEEYSRIDDHIPTGNNNNNNNSNSNSNRSRLKWQKLMKRLVRESKKSMCPSKLPTTTTTTTFQYDAVSYSLNFDEGFHKEELYNHCPQVNIAEFGYTWHVNK
ncbi:hypothetical protein LOK49_LG01G03054 [Camellia lanceoleosa]|uniref:Uncharacterized protein n=1 Tax=Camellia lanceoleosa TaxID=1840588 RepID=A0ACC0IVL9_9ERIC|nr:hypothetical protein LOK49_Contig221G00004 [Camellia lanceoleosa]KAI8029022.1 hypothetical protein LOK49_LG01G03054 [Camellia lanceoleosa]